MALPVRRRDPQTTSGRSFAPFRELDDLRTRTSDLTDLMETMWSGASMPGAEVFTPPVDIEETDDAWVVEAELPGARRDDVNVEVRGSEILVSGEIKERDRKGILRKRTRRVGEFELRIMLPTEVAPDQIEATLDDGVLMVRIPKADTDSMRRVDVQSARG